MIYGFSKSLGVALAARGFPYRVTYTPFLDTKQQYGTGIVVARTRGKNETVGAVVGPKRNPQSVLTRYLSVDVYIFAKSSKPSAHVGEHEDECDGVVDGVLTAASDLVRAMGATDYSVPEARYLSAEERAALGGYVEQWPGVIYYARIVVPRGVARLTYKGEGLPEGTVAAVDTTVKVAGATAGTVHAPAATA